MMKFLLRSLLLSSLCSISSWGDSSGNEFSVTQTPDVTAMEGETVHIQCCWNRDFTRVTVNWLKNQTEIKNVIIHRVNKTLCKTDQDKVACNCSTLTLSNISRNDSATYICKVTIDIPVFRQSEGNGTMITVTARQDTSNISPGSNTEERSLPLPVLISVATLSPLLFITFICLCCLRNRQGKAARVIYEVPHDHRDSSTAAEMADLEEQMGVDGHSTTSSRGSSHWCQVALYESIDYFERAEDKGTGTDEEPHSPVDT